MNITLLALSQKTQEIIKKTLGIKNMSRIMDIEYRSSSHNITRDRNQEKK